MPRPDDATDMIAHQSALPVVRIVARESAAADQLCALAPKGRLTFTTNSETEADAVVLHANGLRAEDRMWVRSQIGRAKSAAVIVIGNNVTDEIACELIDVGASDVLDWATLTTTSLSRAIHLAFARGAQFANRIERPAAPTDASVTLLQECTSAIVMVDPEGIVKFANRDAEQMLGVPEGSLAGSPFALAMDGEGKKEITLSAPGGKDIKAEMRVVETKHGGVPMRVVTLQDVTLRGLLEKHFAA